jgi:hypothetical protein
MLSRVLAGTIAFSITFFVLGFIVFGLFLGPNVMQKYITPDAAKLFYEMPVWAALIVGYLVLGFLVAYIFQNWAGIRTFKGGLIGGAIVLFLLELYFQLSLVAFMKMHTSYIPVIVDVIGTTVIGALAGGVTGVALGMINRNERATGS